MIDEGLAFIESHTVDELSLRELARRLKVSHTAPYRHFQTKEDLLAELIKTGFSKLNDAFLIELNNDKLSFDQLYHRMGVVYVTFFMQHPSLARLMFSSDLCDTEKYPDTKSCGDAAFMSLLEMIQKGQTSGYLMEGDPMPLALTTWSAVHGMASLFMDHQFDHINPEASDSKSVQELVQFLSLALLKGIGKKKSLEA